MSHPTRDAVLAKIRSDVELHGYHLTVVSGGTAPRFAYTIGLHPVVGSEFILAGALFYMLAEIKTVFSEVVRLHRAKQIPKPGTISVSGLGGFSLRPVHDTWSSRLLLGARDYFGLDRVEAFQLIPDEEHVTLDVPEMSAPWKPNDPIWKWIDDVPWDLPVSPSATATTNLDALRGYAVTEVMRWEECDWEMFSGAGPEVATNDIRVVPLATLIGIDASLRGVVDLDVGSGIWREDVRGEWHEWKAR